MAAGKGLARLVRVCCLLAVLGYGAWYAYDRAFQPSEVRRRVQEELTARFENVDVEIGSARLRPFLGGVNVTDLKLIRRDDPTRTPFLHVPHLTIWHDKTDLAKRLTPAKLQFEDAHLTLVHDKTGRWNVEGITKPNRDGESLPIIVLKRTRVEIVDQDAGTSALLNLEEMDVTIVNDPASVFTFEAKGTAHNFGPFQARGRYEAGVGASGQFDLLGVELGGDLARLIGLAAPEAKEYVDSVTGTASARTRWAWRPGRQPPVAYETALEIRDGRCNHRSLPAPVEQLALKARIRDGDLTVESLTGRVGDSGLNIKVELDAPKFDPKLPAVLMAADNLDERLRLLEVTVSDLLVGPDLFERLPPSFAEARNLFGLSGPADVTYEQRRDRTGVRKRCLFRPKGMAAKYRGFPYPVDRVRGTVEAILDDDVPKRYEVDLVGEGGGKPIALKGRVVGGSDREVDLVLSGSDIVLDKTLIDALPDEIPTFVRRLNPMATGDFTARIRHNARTRRDHGPEAFDNEFDIKVRTGALTYEDFPYPLRNLCGNLYIRTVPDTPTIAAAGGLQVPTDIGIAEFRDFTATGSGGCQLRVKGSKRPEPGGAVLVLEAKGESVPLDGELARAIGKLKIENSWATFDPSGRMNCELIVRIHDRAAAPGQQAPAFNPNRDLELGIAFNGPTIRPTFLPYTLTDTAGQVAFAQGRVDLRQFRAKHGKSIVTLPAAEILLPPTGGFWADLYDLQMTPVVIDKELLAALPRGLRSACAGLNPRGDIAIHAKRLVIDDQPKGLPAARSVPQVTRTGHVAAPPARATLPTIYWDASVLFRDVAIETGVAWDSVTGQFSSRGLYAQNRLGRVVGNLAIERGRILRQPIEALTARFEVDPAKPDVIGIPWLNARIYGGEVGGQARLELTTPVRFDLSLNGARLRLEEFAKVNHLGPKTELQGLATAQITLSNPIDPATRTPILHGSGSIDVPNGRILDLPNMVDIIKLARLRPMDHTAFEEAHAVFRIRGDRVRVGQLDLLGNAISLGGEGDMNLDGSNAQFEFYTVWSNIRNMLGGGGDLAARVSGNLYRIRVAGDLGGDKPPRVTQEALPGIVDPIRRLLGRGAK